ncbi:Chemotaxis protein CheY [subsurface metagenome]
MQTRGRILVMNDTELVREVLSAQLPAIGYEGEFAKDGAETIELYVKAKASGCPFDAVILDLEVPGGMGGEETIKKLLEIDPGVKAIISSGNSTHIVITNFVRYGFRGVLIKPYEIEELEEKLNELMKE